jgi:hypothetical protein
VACTLRVTSLTAVALRRPQRPCGAFSARDFVNISSNKFISGPRPSMRFAQVRMRVQLSDIEMLLKKIKSIKSTTIPGFSQLDYLSLFPQNLRLVSSPPSHQPTSPIASRGTWIPLTLKMGGKCAPMYTGRCGTLSPPARWSNLHMACHV